MSDATSASSSPSDVVGRQPVIERLDAGLRARRGLAAHVDLRRGIVADQHDGEAGRDPLGRARRAVSSCQLARACAPPALFRPGPSRTWRIAISQRTADGFRRARPAGGCVAATGGTCARANARRARGHAGCSARARMTFDAARLIVIVAARGHAAARVRGAGQRRAGGTDHASRRRARGAARAARKHGRDVRRRRARDRGAAPRFEAPPERASARAWPSADRRRGRCRWPGLPDDEFQTRRRPKTRWPTKGSSPRRQLARRRGGGRPWSTRWRLSASADDVWIATSAGLYRGRDGACRARRAGGPRRARGGGGGGAVLAATADLLWRRPPAAARSGSWPGGRPPAAAGDRGDRRARGSSPTTTVSWRSVPTASGARVLDRGSAAARRVRRRRARASRATAPIAGRRASRRHAPAIGRPRGRSRAAASRRARFVAAGDGLYTSRDGATWIERVEAPWPGRRPAAAADRPPVGWPPMTASWRWTQIARSRGGRRDAAPTAASRRSPRAGCSAPAAPWPQVYAGVRGAADAAADSAGRSSRCSRSRWSARPRRAAIGGGWRPSGRAGRRAGGARGRAGDHPDRASEADATCRAAQLRAIRQEREALR